MSSTAAAGALPQATFLREFFDVTPEQKNGSHWQSYCKACLRTNIEVILSRDRSAVEHGERAEVRGLKEAELAAKASMAPVGSRPDSLLRHARYCTLLGSPEFREGLVKRRQAEKAANAERIVKSAHRALSDRSNFSGPARFSGPIPGYGPSPSPPRTPAPVYPFAPILPQPLPAYPGTPRFEFGGFGASPAPQAHNYPTQAPAQGSYQPSTPLQRADGSSWMPSDVQREFVADLTRLFAACNIAWNAVEHPETKAFCTKWLPTVDLPSREAMAGPLLKAQVQRAIDNAQRQVSGKLAMAQWDGWKNKARRPVITCLMTVEGEVYLVRSHDTFGKPKTGEYLWELGQSDIDYMREVFGVDLIGLCTDDGPDGKGMRRLARTAFPWLIIVLCWAHQNQLIIGDLIRQNPALKALLGRALDLVKWFLNHGTALALLHHEQTLDAEVTKAVTLLLPVITRWGAHYISVSRLLRLKDAMRTVCIRKSAELLAIRTRADTTEAGSATRTMTAEEVLNLVADNTFWTDLQRAKEHMEPLAISCHVLQADGVRLDQVLLTLANLFRIYAAPHVDADIRQAVHASLEKRWKAADQEVFILAVVFNPFVRTTCFRDTVMAPNVIAEICTQQYTRIMREQPHAQFWAACNRYMNSAGLFTPTRMALERHRAQADLEKTQPDLMSIWRAIQCGDARLPSELADRQLVTFAIRILSVVANSGACERCFSRFGITHTALRNRLAVESTHNINVVRMDVDAAHAAAGSVPSRLKRRRGPAPTARSTEELFGAVGSTASATAGDAATASHPGRNSALQDAVSQLLAHEDAEGDPTSLDALQASLAAGDATQDLPGVAAASGQSTCDEFPPSLAGHFTKVKLADLFRYPTGTDTTPSALEFYWKGGIRELEEEEEIMDAAAASTHSPA